MAANDIHIAGTGSFAAEVAEFARAAGCRVVALVELMDEARVGGRVHGLPVLALGPPPDRQAAIAIAMGRDRYAVAARLTALGWCGAAIVHPTAHVSLSASVSGGAVCGPLAVVGAESYVGEHALLGRGALVGHHTRIGASATLNPGANVAGNCTVGDGAFIGMGATVVPGVTIGRHAVVGAAALVLRDVAPGERVQGVPAQPYTA
jgi:sugar O-acyltransferase (sialic acid O-acetyltransferase NeuD family)